MPMAPLYLFGKDNQDEVQHAFLGYVMYMVLSLAVCHADAIVNGTIVYVSS